MRRRTRITLSIVVVVLLLLAGAVILRVEAPPEVARLLPECDGIVYFNLGPLRAATHFDQRPVQRAPSYQKFIDATGIDPERDLDQAAFALQRMSNPDGPNGAVAYSEVFEGRFNSARLAAWLKSVSSATETYAGRTVYEIPSQGRTVRVTLLSDDLVAVSNTPTAEQIHEIIDRYRAGALSFSGSSLLSAHYHDVPLLAQAWGIGRIALPFGNGSGGISVMGVNVPISPDSTLVASLRWVGKTKLRIEEFAPSAQAAQRSAAAVKDLLTLARTITGSAPPDVKHPEVQADIDTMLAGAEVKADGDRAVLTATIPPGMLTRVLNAPVAAQTAPVPQTQKDQNK